MYVCMCIYIYRERDIYIYIYPTCTLPSRSRRIFKYTCSFPIGFISNWARC